MLKVGSASLVLEMIEAGVAFRDFSLDNPIRAIREVSHDLTGRRPVRLAGGRQASALDIQREYYARAVEHLQTREPNTADRPGRRPVGPPTRRGREPGLRQGRHRDRLGDQAQAVPALSGPLRHGAVRPEDHPARPGLPRHQAGPRRVRPAAAQGPGRADHHRRGDRRGRQHPAADHPGQAARRVHRRRTGSRPRLHRRLGAPQAQRPGTAHRAVQGPVPLASTNGSSD